MHAWWAILGHAQGRTRGEPSSSPHRQIQHTSPAADMGVLGQGLVGEPHDDEQEDGAMPLGWCLDSRSRGERCGRVGGERACVCCKLGL